MYFNAPSHLGQQGVMKTILEKTQHRWEVLSKKALGQDCFVMAIVSLY